MLDRSAYLCKTAQSDMRGGKRPADLIERKRNGEELAADELSELILAYARDEVPDYQMAAWCMAVYFQGLTGGETFALTDAMVRSGETLDLGAALGRKVVDKHSTGGVGDKTSIAVGPIVAACGVPVGKMSGRGLGHTGGTLDKLESIPGFRVELTTDELVAQMREVGMAIVGQTADLVPADKKLYALRDVTATVDIVPLIASSIMSKKLAGGADAIVLDVKVGDGAFMKTLDDARVLAEQMLDLGRRAEREVVCLLTDMEQPLGAAVGNALEVREAVETLRGDGPADLTELVLDACARMLAFSDLGLEPDEGRARAEAAVEDGSALALYRRWVKAQGGDPDVSALPVAPVRLDVPAPRGGAVTRLHALAIGIAALDLGAGRRAKADEIDHAVGVRCLAKRGDSVIPGATIAEVHARDEASAQEAARALLEAYEIGDVPPASRGVLLDVVA
jgi:pyrimidine-nucleoside phosphorylase